MLSRLNHGPDRFAQCFGPAPRRGLRGCDARCFTGSKKRRAELAVTVDTGALKFQGARKRIRQTLDAAGISAKIDEAVLELIPMETVEDAIDTAESPAAQPTVHLSQASSISGCRATWGSLSGG